MNIVMPGKAAEFAARQREQAEKQRAALGVEARTWYRITNQADPDEAEVMLYDDIGGWLGANAVDFIDELKQITAPNIRVRINSPGGSVFEGIAIANALRAHPASVTCQVDGIAASIASVICMAADRVEMCPQTMLMIHEASGMCLGDASDMAEMAELLGLISDNIADAYAAKAGGSREEWRARMGAETWYLPADAVAAGLADEATQTPKTGTPVEEPEEVEPEPEMHRTFDLTAYGYQGPKQPEKPKPAPPAARQAVAEAVLSEDIRSLIGEEVAAQLAAAVQPEPAAEPEVAPEPVAVAPEVVDTASPVHHTATEDRPWDASPNLKRLPSPLTVATAKAMFAWYDDSQVTDGENTKDACSLPHHEVSADGKPGAANIPGVRNALARLPQSNIPAAQHDAVRRHLQAHLDDAKAAENTTEPEPTAELHGEHGPELVDLTGDEPTVMAAVDEAPTDAPVNDWAAVFAHLTQPKPDPWAEAFAHLVNPQPSSSAATAA